MTKPLLSFEVSIAAAHYYLPQELVSVAEWGQSTGQPQVVMAGLAASDATQFHRAAEDETVLCMAAAAVRGLFERCPVKPSAIGYVLHVYTLPFSVPPPPASLPATIARMFGCDNAVALSIAQLNCGSMFGAIQIATGLMRAEPDLHAVLIVTADKVIDEYNRNMRDELILCDSAGALVLQRGGNSNGIAAITRFADPLYRPLPGARNTISRNCTLYHARTARQAIERARLLPDEVDLAFGLNERPATVRHVGRLCHLPEDRLFTDNVSRTGHAFGADFIINLCDWLNLHRPEGGNALVFMNGDNGTFFSLVLTALMAMPGLQT